MPSDSRVPLTEHEKIELLRVDLPWITGPLFREIDRLRAEVDRLTSVSESMFSRGLAEAHAAAGAVAPEQRWGIQEDPTFADGAKAAHDAIGALIQRRNAAAYTASEAAKKQKAEPDDA